MQSTGDVISILAVSQLLLLGGLFVTHFRGLLSALIAMYCFCLIAYLLVGLPFTGDGPWVNFVLFRLATLSPYLLWTIAFYLFVDDRKFPVFLLALIVAAISFRSVGIAISILEQDILNSNVLFTLIHIFPQGVMLGFSIHSVCLAISGYDIDLLEQRRLFRLVFVVLMGALCVVIIGLDFVNLFGRFLPPSIADNLFNIPRSAVSLYVLLIAFAFNLAVFRLDNQAFNSIQKTAQYSPKKKSKESDREPGTLQVIQRIEEVIERDRLYAKQGLTISELAGLLSMQEYKVRRVINKELGHRNFNQFLNNYRIEEASKKLMESSLPVSTIALDVGYSSLSVFNRAFKDRFGTTPTEFRAHQY